MIPNLRDVGETFNTICNQAIMKEAVLFRGGTVNELFDETELPNVSCILNLRTGKDQLFPSMRQSHIPAVDSVENYSTSNGQVRNWANRVLTSICHEKNFPLLVHCTAGKDRTGVIVALILKVIEVDDAIIIEEYLQTEGQNDSANIQLAMEGIGDASDYLYDSSAINFLKNQLLISC